MFETVVSSTFNFFDIFVRLGPGCILVACYYCCFNNTIPSLNMDSTFTLVLNIAIAYIAGTLVRAPCRITKKALDKLFFGGNPRNKFSEKISGFPKVSVIKEEVTRKVAEKLVDYITEQHNSYELGILDKDIQNHFAFSHMVSYLELKGKSNKTDRICGLVDMCLSVTTTLIICIIMLFISQFFSNIIGNSLGLEWNLVRHANIISYIILSIGIICSSFLYIRYTQMRFFMVVQQYNIWKDMKDPYNSVLLDDKIKEMNQNLYEINKKLKRIRRQPTKKGI